MGMVVVKDETIFLSRGYPCNKATLYVYCDCCGSFDIRAYLGPRKWLTIAAPLIYVGFVVLVLGRPGVVNAGWMLLGLLGAVVLGVVPTTGNGVNKRYRCRKCGSTISTRYNSRNYSSGSMTLDVQEERIEKHYLEYWPDLCDLNEWLKPPSQTTS